MNGLAHQLLSCAHEAMRQAGLKAESLLGIGIAGSGLVNSQEGTMVMSSTIESIKHVPLRRIFEKEFAVPVQVTNFASAKAVAERTLGAGAMTEDMIYVEYGKTGIGAGIISGGQMVHGGGGEGGGTWRYPQNQGGRPRPGWGVLRPRANSGRAGPPGRDRESHR